MIHAEHNRALLLITVLGGPCVKETAALLVSDVVDEFGQVRNVIHLRPEQTKNKREHSETVCRGLKTELQRYVAIFNEINPTDPFFYTQKRKGCTPNTLTQHFFWLYKRAGVNGASSHSGRRTFITTLAAKGVSVRVLAALAGHANISTTQSYIDVNDDMKRQAVALL